ncbi:MAG TPA: Tad domain-containing protein [Symbiobacteriaceae bacterium]|nr:Tad domain-containing protein [Symbiobacteriaceae bacterium]
MAAMLNRLRRETQGAVMVMAASTLTILLLFAGLALDFGRAHLLRAQLQTAVDAASLAGALQVIPMVELTIDRWEEVVDTCTDPVTKKPYSCRSWEWAPPAQVSGPQWDLLNLGQWRARAGAQCSSPYRCSSPPRVTREWLVLPESTVPVARNTFSQNAQWPGGALGPQVQDVTITMNQAKAEVTARATMTMPTTFLKLVGIRELRFTRTGSAVPVKR